ncbi:tetratricopeptide repeat protein [Amycolatopsis sp. NPDC051106]|uniref:ATP-binding protein n=1 Tax=unclassified Amycolatopsis TaxID=2618356 RepID=UPI00342C8EBB
MTVADQREEGRDDASSVRPHNAVLGAVIGSVVQANKITGGIHYHLPRQQILVPRQLPPNPTPFVGRAHELSTLSMSADHPDDVGGVMLISALAGAGGIGKTWLAVHWAHEHAAEFADGQLFVDLHGFAPSGASLPATDALRMFLEALGIAPAHIPADLGARTSLYRSLVANKRMLIVLDNAATGEQVEPLLPNSPACTVLVTSRKTLSTLITRYGAKHLPLSVLSEDEAHVLLTRRLGHTRVTTERDAAKELIRLCGRHPLALALMACRAHARPQLPLAEFAAELCELGLAALDGDDPLTSLPKVLSWSVQDFTDQQHAVFALLGIGPGPDISLPAAAGLTGLDERQVASVMRQLEEASVLDRHPGGRYSMHDLVRAYAAATAHNDLTEETRIAALRRVVDFYTHTACAADRLLAPHRTPIPVGPAIPGANVRQVTDGPAAMTWFDAERADLLAAQHVAKMYGWHDAVWQLAWGLTTFSERRGQRQDQLTAWRATLDVIDFLPDPTARMNILRNLGHAYTHLGRHEESIKNLHQALELAAQHDKPIHEAHVHRMLAWDWGRQGSNRRALAHAVRALDLYRVLDLPAWEANAFNTVGWYAAQLADYDTARTYCQTALALHRRHDNSDGEANTLDSLGYIARRTGDHKQAIHYYRQACSLLRVLGDTYASASALDCLGGSYAAVGKNTQARTAWREAQELYRQQGRDSDVERVQCQLDTCGHQPLNFSLT